MSSTANLAERLASTDTGQDPDIWLPLLRLLGKGQPVQIDTLAAAAAKTIPEIIRALARVPDTEYDDNGRIIGQGLTLKPTRHHIEINDTKLYTWCALDTLIFPAILGASAHVESSCQASGAPIRITITTSGVTSVQPAGAVVSLVNPEDMTSVRSAFCNQVHFFASAKAAGPWLAAHPGGSILPIEDAYRLGTTIAENLLPEAPEQPPSSSGAGAASCCC